MSKRSGKVGNTPAGTPSSGKPYQSPAPKLKLNDNTGEIWTKLEEALLKQSESIKNSLTLIISESEERLSKKIDDEIATLKSSIEDMNKRIRIIKTQLITVDTIKQENEQLKQQLNQHNDSINNILKRLEETEEKHKQKEISSDALLQGVPFLPQENLRLMFDNMCAQVGGLQPPSLKNIFRLKTQNNNNYPHAPIVIKFLSPTDKSMVLRSIANHRKTSQQPLRLRDLGFNDNDNNNRAVFIHECLTVKNRSLLQTALKLKRDNKLFSVFTMRGIVHIKKTSKERPTMINNAEDLAIFAADLTTTNDNEADYKD